MWEIRVEGKVNLMWEIRAEGNQWGVQVNQSLIG